MIKRLLGSQILFFFIPSLLFANPRHPLPETPSQVWQNDLDLQDDLKSKTSILTSGTSGYLLTAQGVGNNPIWSLPGIVQTLVYTSQTSSATTSTTFVDTGLAGTITPTKTTSRILFMASASCSTSLDSFSYYYDMDRDGTKLSSSSDGYGRFIDNGGSGRQNVTFFDIDSPASTSTLTYTVQMRSENASNTVTWGGTGTQVLILIEIGN